MTYSFNKLISLLSGLIIIALQLPIDAGGIVNFVNTEGRSSFRVQEGKQTISEEGEIIHIKLDINNSSHSGKGNLIFSFRYKDLGDDSMGSESIVVPFDMAEDINFHLPKRPFTIGTPEANWLPGERPEHWYYLRSCLFEENRRKFLGASMKEGFLPPMYLVRAIEVQHTSKNNEISIEWDKIPGAEFYQVNIFAGIHKTNQPKGREAFVIMFPFEIARTYTQSPSFALSDTVLMRYFEKLKHRTRTVDYLHLHSSYMMLYTPREAGQQIPPVDHLFPNHHIGIQVVARGASQEVLSKSPYYYITTIEFETEMFNQLLKEHEQRLKNLIN